MSLNVSDLPPNPPSSFPDLLARARGGDADATSQLFEQFYPRVQRQVHMSLATDLRNSRPWLQSRFSTGDVVQEVFRSAFMDLEAFGGATESSFAAYLTMIVRNRLVDAIRFHEAEQRDGRRRSTPLVEEAHPSDEESAERSAIARDSIQRLHEVIDEFPQRERLLIRARFEGTATFEELTEQLGYSSVTTARRTFFAAQARLAILLDESGDAQGEAKS